MLWASRGTGGVYGGGPTLQPGCSARPVWRSHRPAAPWCALAGSEVAARSGRRCARRCWRRRSSGSGAKSPASGASGRCSPRRPRRAPADPGPTAGEGAVRGLLPCRRRPARDPDLCPRHRQPQVASRSPLGQGEDASLRTVPGAGLGARPLPAHRTDRPRPAQGHRRPSSLSGAIVLPPAGDPCQDSRRDPAAPTVTDVLTSSPPEARGPRQPAQQVPATQQRPDRPVAAKACLVGRLCREWEGVPGVAANPTSLSLTPLVGVAAAAAAPAPAGPTGASPRPHSPPNDGQPKGSDDM